MPPRTAVEQLRRRAFGEKYRQLTLAKRIAIALFRVSLYPLATFPGIVSAIRHLPKFGVQVGWSEFFPMYAAALFRNIPPVEYVLFGFTDPAVRRQSGDYLYWMDQPAMQWLNRNRGADNRDVQDKARFAAICLREGLPHAAVLGEFRAGAQISGSDPASWTASGLWVKPASGSGGHGCRLWHRTNASTWQAGSDLLTTSEWADLLRRSACIVQEPLLNHPEMNGLTNGAAVVLRMVTVLDRAGTCTLIGSSVALPQGLAESTAGALGCVPDLHTGAIARVSLAGSDETTTHPDTGERLVGRVLPCWTESRELVLHAHRQAFPAFASLGWDVVVTPDGPVLLETNSGWGTMGQQMDFEPLGRSPLGKIAEEELERSA